MERVISGKKIKFKGILSSPKTFELCFVIEGVDVSTIKKLKSSEPMLTLDERRSIAEPFTITVVVSDSLPAEFVDKLIEKGFQKISEALERKTES